MIPLYTWEYAPNVNWRCLKSMLVLLRTISHGIRVIIMPLFVGEAFSLYTAPWTIILVVVFGISL